MLYGSIVAVARDRPNRIGETKAEAHDDPMLGCMRPKAAAFDSTLSAI